MVTWFVQIDGNSERDFKVPAITLRTVLIGGLPIRNLRKLPRINAIHFSNRRCGGPRRIGRGYADPHTPEAVLVASVRGRCWRRCGRWLGRIGVGIVSGVFGWGFDDEGEAMIGEPGVVVEVERDVEVGGLPDGEAIFPLGSGGVLRGDGFFARGAAESLERVGRFIHEHRDFDELAAVENPIGGFAIAFGMVGIDGRGGGDFGALVVFDGVEQTAAGGAVGIFVADFHFAASFQLEAQKALHGLADHVAVDFKRAGRGRCRLRRRGLLRGRGLRSRSLRNRCLRGKQGSERRAERGGGERGEAHEQRARSDSRQQSIDPGGQNIAAAEKGCGGGAPCRGTINTQVQHVNRFTRPVVP